MAGSRNGEKDARASRERLRVYTARRTVHEKSVQRRKRDNLLAILAGLVIVALATVAQFTFFTVGPGAPEPTPSATAEPSASPDPAAEGENVGDVPDPALAESRTWTGELELNSVPLAIELDGAAAPQAVAAFVQEVTDDYFVDKSCHRLTDGGFFVLQCGSLDGTGAGDPSFSFGPIENAPVDDVYAAGTIAMARAQGDAYSNGRQFFIVYDDTTIPSDAAGGYTVIGKVTSGLDQLKAEITDAGLTPVNSENDGTPVVPTTITRVTIG
ncbi:peptidyl-prolyl cis-trans isomerase B (cyclophilin B) [Homoserinimonas aerilata]|uniref:peptidylprolyl isomerase n=1 Tax=Homoserinimonas aerilata TaxID=1162970 RepID=A0A542YIN0_9MICO|nr:peptidylprolyl isomerase [Homoserinimonas aerilata]TQL47955.1 peptidyl-prolyl cis-trans isomerase B (cyclophilin B) [Homoserinimonas aerilata]